MKKYILLYNGPATDAMDMAPELRDSIMRKWGEWMGKVGSSMVDMGQPMVKQGLSLVDDGSTKTPAELNGYSIIEANSLEEAKSLVEGHPFLSDKTGKFSVDIYELMPASKM